MSLVPFSIESLYPTPERRIENPAPTVYQPGDIVKILIGPATDRLGRVVVERNGNYHDYEPYSASEGIGVEVVERRGLAPELEKMIAELTDPECLVHKVVRWFDNPQQLELVRKAQSTSKKITQ